MIAHPLIGFVMTYKTADFIRSMIYALSIEAKNDDLGCSCIERSDNTGEWECHLYSRDEFWATYNHLVMLAINLCMLVPSLTYYQGHCDIGRLKGEKVVESVVIW